MNKELHGKPVYFAICMANKSTQQKKCKKEEIFNPENSCDALKIEGCEF